MEIKPMWLLELAPHFFRSVSAARDSFRSLTGWYDSAKDLQDIQDQQKKMPKVVGSVGEPQK